MRAVLRGEEGKSGRTKATEEGKYSNGLVGGKVQTKELEGKAARGQR